MLMKAITVLTPENISAPLPSGFTPAYMLYRVMADGRLYRAEASFLPSGGIMGVSFESGACSPSLASEITAEAKARGFSALLFDAPQENPVSVCETAALCSASLPVYAPAFISEKLPNAFVLTETALFSGTLKARLEDAVGRFGRERVVADVERLRMEFSPPASDERGRILTGAELSALFSRRTSGPHYSPDLAAWYFNYRDGEQTRFVLYDDLQSLRRKTALISSLGIGSAVFSYREVSDVIGRLFGQPS